METFYKAHLHFTRYIVIFMHKHILSERYIVHSEIKKNKKHYASSTDLNVLYIV